MIVKISILVITCFVLILTAGESLETESQLFSQFKFYDANSDGLLNQQEQASLLTDMVRQSGEDQNTEVILSQSYYIQIMKSMFAKADLNKDGISFEEFKKMVEAHNESEQQSDDQEYAL